MASHTNKHTDNMTAANGSSPSPNDAASSSPSKQKKAAKKKDKFLTSPPSTSSSTLQSNDGSADMDAASPAPNASSDSSLSPFSRVSSFSIVPVVPPFDSRRFLTSSSLPAATAMVDMLIQFIRDSYKSAEAHQSFIQKTYVLEVQAGANHGRNLWQFLVSLSERVAELADILNIALTDNGNNSAQAHEANHNTLAALTPFAAHFTYILTDPLQSHLDNFKQHPQLAPFFDIGLVEIAQFDPTDPTAYVIHGAAHKGPTASEQSMELYLQYSSSLLTTLDSHHPILVLSNEIMTAAPPAAPSAATKGKSASSTAVACNWKFDAYSYDPHQRNLHQYELATRNSEKPSAFPSVEWNLNSEPMTNINTTYSQPEYNAVLERYLQDLNQIAFPSPSSPPQPLFVQTLPKAAASAADAPSQTFTVPITAFNFLYSLRQFARGPMLLLVAERGFSSLVTLPNQVPSLGFTTSRSASGSTNSIPIPVNLLNLHALQVLTKEMKGYTLAQSSRTVSTVRVSGFGFESAPTAGDEEELEPLPVPNRTASPVKSALKSPSSPREIAADHDSEEKVAGEELNGSNGGSGKKVKFLGLTWKEQKALKKAERERQQQLAAQQAHRQALASRRDVPPPANLSCAFLRNYQVQNPFEAANLMQLCLTNAAVTNTAVNGSKTATPQYPSLTSKHALSLLSSSYEVDAYMRLKSLIFSPFPSSHKKIASHLRAQVFYPNSPMEFDLFQSLRRVWSYYIALPSDIYGVLPSHANTDLAYEFGTFFMLRRRFRTALAYFQRSLDIFLPRPITLFNMAQCWIKLKAFVPAREKLQQALAADPSYQQAQQWLDWIENQVGSDQDRSRDDASEKADIESAFQDPYQEEIGEIEEDEETEPAPVEESKVSDAASTSAAPIALPPTTITLEQAKAQEALVEKMRGLEMKDDDVNESERAKQIEKKKAFREKEKARKAEKKRQAAEQKQPHQANGSVTPATANGNTDAHSKSVSTALPAPIQTSSSSQKQKVVPTSAQSTPLVTPSPAASPTLQSFLKPTSSRLWSEMEDDEELPNPLSPSNSKRVPSQEKPKNHTQQHSKQQNGHHQPNMERKSKPNEKQAAQSDRFARPADADGSKISNKPYHPPNKRNQPKSNAQ